jgi:O-acetyl-ADP-ribose deacetylase (regulator of RNase III)
MERRIGRTTVAVQQADITRLTVEAVVSAANPRLWMGGAAGRVHARRGS